MKSKSLVLMLVLTVAAWAQTAAPAGTPQSTAPDTKAKSTCCDKMASTNAKNGQSCMRPMAQNGNAKEMACCARKDGKSCCGDEAQSCMRSDKEKGCCGKTTASCCAHSKQASDGATDSGRCCCSGKSEKAACCSYRGMMPS
jgi:hypothetical protein